MPSSEPVLRLSPDQALQAIESLPTEIISSITSFLPIPAVLSLRRSSRTLASKVLIGQPFWRDRLISGDLIDYLWDLDVQNCYQRDEEGSWDWRTLAQKLAQPKILKSALGKSLANGEIDETTTRYEQMSLQETALNDAPIGLQNRCRIVQIVKDIEKLDKIEAEEPVVDGEKQRHLGLLWADLNK